MSAESFQVHQDGAGKVRRTRRPRHQVDVVVIDKRVLQLALRLAGGDARRLILHADGSVVVANSRDETGR